MNDIHRKGWTTKSPCYSRSNIATRFINRLSCNCYYNENSCNYNSNDTKSNGNRHIYI